jgi:hypothetical protein
MNADQRCHAFGDESCRGGTYRLAVVLVRVAELAKARGLLRAELLRGQRSIHFTDEKDPRRRRLLAVFGRVASGVEHYPAGLAEFGSAEEARAELLRALAVDLAKAGVTRLVLESRGSRDHRDRLVLRAVLGADPPLAYEHMHKYEEPLLWLADGFAWAEGRGGAWAERARAAANTAKEAGRR